MGPADALSYLPDSDTSLDNTNVTLLLDDLFICTINTALTDKIASLTVANPLVLNTLNCLHDGSPLFPHSTVMDWHYMTPHLYFKNHLHILLQYEASTSSFLSFICCQCLPICHLLQYGGIPALPGSRDTSCDIYMHTSWHRLPAAYATSPGLRLQGSRSRDHNHHSLARDIPQASHDLGLAFYHVAVPAILRQDGDLDLTIYISDISPSIGQ